MSNVIDSLDLSIWVALGRSPGASSSWRFDDTGCGEGSHVRTSLERDWDELGVRPLTRSHALLEGRCGRSDAKQSENGQTELEEHVFFFSCEGRLFDLC